MDLNKHIVTNSDNKPFHNSGFAVIANGDRLGSTSSVSFSQRQQIERSRQRVAGYQHSALGSTYGVLRAKPAARRVLNRNVRSSKPSLQQRNSIGLAPRHFKEPAARAYNPYG